MKTNECLSLLTEADYVIKRPAKKRKIISAVRLESAKQAIGHLDHDCEIYGFTKGQFSLIDIIEHCIEQTGPADVTISTWSAASGDISAANRLMSEKQILSMKFLIDASFKSRKPEFCEQLLECFGADCIRVSSVHAKFCTIKNDNWNLVIRTSMNLNNNPRFENFEISDDADMFDFMSKIVDEIWSTQSHYDETDRRSKSDRDFGKLFNDGSLISVSAGDLTPGKI